MTRYDDIGRGYARTRQPDPRIAARLDAALAGAGTVVNVGAGAGSYEPPATVLAVEPSTVMLAQRPAGSAPAVRAVAEQLPLKDKSVDAALAVLTVHHWHDVRTGLAELRRIVRRRIVILTWDHAVTREFWLFADYLPAAAAHDQKCAVPLRTLTAAFAHARVEPVLVPANCTDGFAGAYWQRPAEYLRPEVRAGISALSQVGDPALRAGLDRLAADVRSGAWGDRYGHLMDVHELDLGYRLVIAEP